MSIPRFKFHDAPISMNAAECRRALNPTNQVAQMNAVNREFWEGRNPEDEVTTTRDTATGMQAHLERMNRANKEFWARQANRS
jgi:hypothetical protein